ncbi:MAG: hypothetical protein QOI25_4687 [Mycobacterium sp.]|jgi:hypothetical protein|nr:hypothetical protein [Mycobacterium sp.]
MTDSAPARRPIEVDAEVYDVLERTAASRSIDINGALRYLIEVHRAAGRAARRRLTTATEGTAP